MSFDFIRKHKDLFTVLGLGAIFYLIFFHNIGNYALMDSDETRYVWMSRDMFNLKDFLTLRLNGDYFFEKPPLYFWGECLSFAIFGQITEFTARFPVALYGTISAFLVYFVGKRLVSRDYGIISALILATSLEFIILSKLAILDIVLTVCVGLALYSGFMTFFCEDKNKKYFWWLFYLFSGLSVLAKGIPGFVIPFGTMFFASLVSKRFKELFRPQYILVGIPLFLLVVLPWHIIMFKMYDPLFFQEYIMKHHLARFISSKDLGRKEPFCFFFLVLLWGFIPWVFSSIAVLITKIKKLKLELFKNFSWDSLDNSQKFLTLNTIAFLFILLFFSSSSTKLITYILPIYFPMAFLMGAIWQKYIANGENEKAINISVYVANSILVLASIVAIFMNLYLPQKILTVIEPVKWFAVSILFVFPLAGIISALKNKRTGVFVAYVALMVVISAFGTKEFFNLNYRFGQNDLIKFATYAKEKDGNLASFGFGRRYSLGYYYGKKMTFQQEKDFGWLDNFLSSSNSLVVIKNKELDKISKNVKFTILEEGTKYSLIKR